MVSSAGGRAVRHSGHGWLAAVLPAATSRVFVADEELSSVLTAAGAELVTTGADVEVGAVEALPGEAPVAVATLDRAPGGSAGGRVGRRLAAASRLRLDAAAARRRLRALGYPSVRVQPWGIGHPLRIPGLAGPGRALPERLAQRAVVVAHRGAPEPTVYEAALAAASEAAERALAALAPTVRFGVLLGMTDDVVLRVAIGPGAGQVEAQHKALERLRASSPPSAVADRAPWPLGNGRAGLAVWTSERRLPGNRPAPALTRPILEESVDFLVALHQSGRREEPVSLAAAAAVIGSAAADPEAVRALAARADDALAEVARGFAHGDFFRGNLLVQRDRLAGVIDWDAAGAGRLPLVDLLHLRHYTENRPRDLDWGPLLVERLLPWARNGGDDLVRAYLERVDVERDPATLEALVAAYWLERAAYQLRIHPQRREQPNWIARNIDGVVRTLRIG
jgi:aminoglycoside phosphotransferase (APT) family kinase protein